MLPDPSCFSLLPVQRCFGANAFGATAGSCLPRRRQLCGARTRKEAAHNLMKDLEMKRFDVARGVESVSKQNPIKASLADPEQSYPTAYWAWCWNGPRFPDVIGESWARRFHCFGAWGRGDLRRVRAFDAFGRAAPQVDWSLQAFFLSCGKTFLCVIGFLKKRMTASDVSVCGEDLLVQQWSHVP